MVVVGWFREFLQAWVSLSPSELGVVIVVIVLGLIIWLSQLALWRAKKRERKLRRDLDTITYHLESEGK